MTGGLFHEEVSNTDAGNSRCKRQDELINPVAP
jgi:hypothetical protein